MYDENKLREYCEKYNVQEEDVLLVYYSRIEPFLAVITDFKVGIERIRHRELRVALGINSNIWRVCVAVFEELQEALRSNTSVLKLKAQIDLQKGINASEHKNAKMLEMQLIRYDDDYKPKGREADIDIPKLVVEFVDSRIEETVLEELYDEKIKKQQE